MDYLRRCQVHARPAADDRRASLVMAGSADDLARITGKAKSNLSCTLAIAGGSGLVRLKRGWITPKAMHDFPTPPSPPPLAQFAPGCPLAAPCLRRSTFSQRQASPV